MFESWSDRDGQIGMGSINLDHYRGCPLEQTVLIKRHHTDDTSGYVYWSDPAERFIHRVSFDSSNLKTIVSDVRSDSLAIDWISGNLYWINYQVK